MIYHCLVFVVTWARTRWLGYSAERAGPTDVLRNYKIAAAIQVAIVILLVVVSVLLEYSREHRLDSPTNPKPGSGSTAAPIVIAGVLILSLLLEGMCMYRTITTLMREATKPLPTDPDLQHIEPEDNEEERRDSDEVGGEGVTL